MSTQDNASLEVVAIDTVNLGGTAYVRIQYDGHSILVSGIGIAALDLSDFIWG